MTGAVALRKATARDALMLAGWRNENREFFPPGPPLTVQSHTRWWHDVYLPDPWDHLYVVTAGGKPAGTIGIRADTREIGRVMLGDKTLARRGVMSRALGMLLAAYPGMPAAWLRVLPGNTTAVSFYKANGFTAESGDEGFLVMRYGG